MSNKAETIDLTMNSTFEIEPEESSIEIIQPIAKEVLSSKKTKEIAPSKYNNLFIF
ncbi:17710_t:CDS:2 [Funneliformis geosporum]|uniref:17710_t:CDS:1 n=1 Tax=Funneliformis geosporum TaxID=1117311 RepID=A0A9W4SQA1_9GLOM|nr:17710_t:CDS:2 [Funneliformis geosporum]